LVSKGKKEKECLGGEGVGGRVPDELSLLSPSTKTKKGEKKKGGEKGRIDAPRKGEKKEKGKKKDQIVTGRLYCATLLIERMGEKREEGWTLKGGKERGEEGVRCFGSLINHGMKREISEKGRKRGKRTHCCGGEGLPREVLHFILHKNEEEGRGGGKNEVSKTQKKKRSGEKVEREQH